MDNIIVQFLGSSDAFSSGGRFQSCIHVKTAQKQFLLDCGSSVLIAMNRFNINPHEIEAILLSHLHGDHFGGIPFFLLDAQHLRQRKRPLIIAGPVGLQQRICSVMEGLFPGSMDGLNFSINFVELIAGQATQFLEEFKISPYSMIHPSGASSLALRVEYKGKVLTYTGDTEWTEELISASEDADLLIIECTTYATKVKYHLDYHTILTNQEKLKAKKIVLTHMSTEMLRMLPNISHEYAEDGKVFNL